MPPAPLHAGLSAALRVFLYSGSVLRSPYFRCRDSNYILQVLTSLEDCAFLPGDYVCRFGDEGREMFFIRQGVC